MAEQGLVLWASPNGIKLPTNFQFSESGIVNLNKQLKPSEVKKIVSAFDGQAYDMATEYIWARTLSRLRERISVFGAAFVTEMIGGSKEIGIDELSSVEVISLATDLGFINETAKLRFIQTNELINHFMSTKSDGEEMDRIDAEGTIKACIQFVLGYDSDNTPLEFAKFRDELRTEPLNPDSPSVKLLSISPYFYKRTAVRTILNLIKTTKGAEFERVSANAISVIPEIWNSLNSDDRWPVGFSYAGAVNDANNGLVKVLKALLMKVQGFDYVPENLRSMSFIDVANEILRAHYEADNFYNEPVVVKKLANMGSVIPAPAFNQCINALLCCKLGNTYGISWAAQNHVDQIFSSLSEDRWVYYFDSVFPFSENVLRKLSYANDSIQAQFRSFLRLNPFKHELVSVPIVRRIIKNAEQKEDAVVQKLSRKLFDELQSSDRNT